MSKNRRDLEHKAEESAPAAPPKPAATIQGGKREVMLKPSWPGTFHRTVGTGEKAKRLAFPPGEPVEVSDEEFKALKADIGIAIFEIERDEKGRPRFIESVPSPVPTSESVKQEMERDVGENV